MTAWQSVRMDQPNPLAHLLAQDAGLRHYLSPVEIENLMQVDGYMGIAPQRSRELAERILAEIHRLDDGARIG